MHVFLEKMLNFADTIRTDTYSLGCDFEHK